MAKDCIEIRPQWVGTQLSLEKKTRILTAPLPFLPKRRIWHWIYGPFKSSSGSFVLQQTNNNGSTQLMKMNGVCKEMDTYFYLCTAYFYATALQKNFKLVFVVQT